MAEIIFSGCNRSKSSFAAVANSVSHWRTPSAEHLGPLYKVWVAENSVVLAWLFNSLEPNISRCYLWSQTAKEAWEAARKMYSDLGNSSQIFELRSKLKAHPGREVGHRLLLRPSGHLARIGSVPWRFVAMCHLRCQITVVPGEREGIRFAGLNRNLDDVRGRVVARDPFPSPEDAFADVKREEMRRKVMLYDDISPNQSAPDVSALVSHKTSPPATRMSKRPWCEHCKRPVIPSISAGKFKGSPLTGSPARKVMHMHFRSKPTQMSLEIMAHPNHSPRIGLSRLNSIVSSSIKCPPTLHPVLLSGHAHWPNLVWCFRPSPQNLLDLGLLI